MKKLVVWFLVILFVVAAVAGGWFVLRAEHGLSAAERDFRKLAWKPAREHLQRYLWLHPHSPEANLMMAEALVRDDRLTGKWKLEKAIAHLQRVPDDSPLAAEALMREARVRFLLLYQPARAERLLKRSLDLNPDGQDANYLMWKLLDLTGRAHLAAPYFWKVYEASPEDEQPLRLREWYMSQFFPAAANPEFDRRMGFIQSGEASDGITEFMRLEQFRLSEPDAPLNHAMYARALQHDRQREEALAALEKASSLPDAFDDPVFVATMVSLLVELGRFDQARAVFDRWPEPHSGYEYWLHRGMILDEVEQDPGAAIDSYIRALSAWPGPIDWSTYNRLANCMLRLGQTEKAKQFHRKTRNIEQTLNNDALRLIREELADHERPATIRRMIEFYESLGCDREARCWREVFKRVWGESPGQHR